MKAFVGFPGVLEGRLLQLTGLWQSFSHEDWDMSVSRVHEPLGEDISLAALGGVEM